MTRLFLSALAQLCALEELSRIPGSDYPFLDWLTLVTIYFLHAANSLILGCQVATVHACCTGYGLLSEQLCLLLNLPLILDLRLWSTIPHDLLVSWLNVFQHRPAFLWVSFHLTILSSYIAFKSST